MWAVGKSETSGDEPVRGAKKRPPPGSTSGQGAKLLASLKAIQAKLRQKRKSKKRSVITEEKA